MAKQFDNSIALFSRPSSVYPAVAAATFAMVGLLAGLVMALAVRNWPMVIISLISLGGLTAFAYLSLSRIRRLIAAGERDRIDWDTAPPDVQRESLNIEVGVLSKILEVEREQLGDLQSAYIVAEDLALRQLQQEENIPLLRHVSVGGVPFDAVMTKGDLLVCVEVMFLVSPEVRSDKLNAVMRKIASAGKAVKQRTPRMNVRLMLVLITQLAADDESQLRSMLNKQKFAETSTDVEIRLLDFEELQRVFITD